MMQPSDNELDKLFKEAGDNYQATGANPDWKEMEALLDKHMPVSKDPWRRRFFLFILLFLLLGGTYIYFYDSTGKSSKTGKEQHALNIPSGTIVSPPAHPNGNGTTVNGSQQEQKSLLRDKEQQPDEKDLVSKRNIRKKNKTAGKTKISIYTAEVGENNQSPGPGDMTSSTNKKERANTTGDLTTETTPQTEIKDKGVNNKIPEKTVPQEDTIAENKTPVVTEKTAAGKKNKNSQKRKNPLEFSLVYAPELTTIRFSNTDKPGSNYGLLVGYHISKNLTLQTGLIKSRKNYIADGNDFTLSFQLPPNHKLDRVDGYCMMYEIPLNIKSQFSNWKKLNWFYTAGISSYFMKSEFYKYFYITNYGDYTKSFRYDSQQNYWLSVATIGLGLEKTISNGLTVAAAPFIKIPFRGMGAGKLKLTGMGINFSLSYVPAFAKK
ncbi:MAG: hypothetical protein ABI760_02095 [Ferruginibacter sp.]